MSTPTLLLDRQAASSRPDESAVRSWGAGQHIFVSSLITDMPEERAAARAAIQSIGAVPVMFEFDLGGQDVPADRAYLDGVRQSGIYVGIFGPRYGVRLASGRSATHDELFEAERLGLRLCLFVAKGGLSDSDGDQRDLLNGLRNLYTTGSFVDASDLRSRIAQRLADLAAEEILPWVRLGRLLIRAQSIDWSGETVSVSATIADRSILAELKALETSRAIVPFATHLDAFDVQIQLVTSSVTMSTSTSVGVTLRRKQGNGGSAMSRMQVNGVSADEQIRRSLSDGMFGTRLLPQERFGGFLSAVNPLAPMVGLAIPEVALRPIAQLLLTEFLIRDQHASVVDPIELGPSHQGTRTLRVMWHPPRPYSNSPDPAAMELSGQISSLG